MWFYYVMAVFVGVAFGVLIQYIFSSEPKIDGHLVVTHNDGKTTMSFEFDDEDQMIELRNKQRVIFEVVGPERIES